ncbi:hypothetical protein Emin_0871 [Elusimicrobium minutum Pei191]|uniref:Lipoprotein n=1 Tax=Elusimicrobium minutum (strain Pei191) TaxID=445932 RepID=B2KD30_ELUMP|nr:hypothetical protein [Elusimicrobium minutum]ACC98426.1 hypothetical protein Emin_0871 [Elusimicrobium minutum Pei191]
MWKIVFLLILTMIVFACKGKESETKLTPISPMYEDIRNLWLSGLPKDQLESVEFVGSREIYTVGIELVSKDISDGKNRIFIVGSTSGDASIYFQSKNEEGVGGYIGGQGHENIRNSARKMVVDAEKRLINMHPSEFPEIKPGHMTFFALSKDGTLYTAQIKEKEIIDNKDPFSNFFYDANDIITGFRVVQEKQQAEQKVQ